MEEKLLKADAQVERAGLSPLVDAQRVPLRKLAPQVRVQPVRRAARRQLALPPAVEVADAQVVDVVLLLRRLEDFSPRLNSVAALRPRLARERAAVHGGWVRKAYRSSNRHTGASRLTT